MISWMSKEVDELWDKANSDGIGLNGIVCEIHDEELKGHIIIQLEIGDDYSYQLDLGDCTGLSDKEINERFVRKFPDFIKEYENDENCIGPLVEDLQELSDKFLATIG